MMEYFEHGQECCGGSFLKGVLGFCLGFVIAVSLYEGLFVLRSWIFAAVILLSVAELGYKIRKE